MPKLDHEISFDELAPHHGEKIVFRPKSGRKGIVGVMDMKNCVVRTPGGFPFKLSDLAGWSPELDCGRRHPHSACQCVACYDAAMALIDAREQERNRMALRGPK